MKVDEAFGERRFGIGFNQSAGDITERISVFFDDAPSGFLQTGVYADDFHGESLQYKREEAKVRRCEDFIEKSTFSGQK